MTRDLIHEVVQNVPRRAGPEKWPDQ